QCTNAIIFIVSLLLCAFVAASPRSGGSPSPADAHRGDSAWLIVENRRDLGKDAVEDALASRKDSAWLFHPVEPQSVGKEDTA
ncbi:hypothetical protein BKA70DRAFT_1269344, partial [Coprinopsis sp. MPI-PUGE-AT-0042]